MLTRIYRIDSKDKSTYETIDNFRYKLDYVYKEINLVSLTDFICYNTIYTVNNNNNTFTLTYLTTDYTITLTNGFYSPGTLATEIKTKMDASGSTLVFTVTNPSLTSKFTISSSANFGLTFTDHELLGFTSNKTGASTYTSDVCYKLTGAPYLILTIEELDNIEIMIPMNASQGSMVYYEQRRINPLKNTIKKNIDKLSIKITDNNKKAVDFNGLDVTINIGLRGIIA